MSDKDEKSKQSDVNGLFDKANQRDGTVVKLPDGYTLARLGNFEVGMTDLSEIAKSKGKNPGKDSKIVSIRSGDKYASYDEAGGVIDIRPESSIWPIKKTSRSQGFDCEVALEASEAVKKVLSKDVINAQDAASLTKFIQNAPKLSGDSCQALSVKNMDSSNQMASLTLPPVLLPAPTTQEYLEAGAGRGFVNPANVDLRTGIEKRLDNISTALGDLRTGIEKRLDNISTALGDLRTGVDKRLDNISAAFGNSVVNKPESPPAPPLTSAPLRNQQLNAEHLPKFPDGVKSGDAAGATITGKPHSGERAR